MRILVLGAGGTGGYFGGRLAEAGVDVTFLVRPARAAQLDAEGLVIRSPLGDAQLQVPHVTAEGLGAAAPFDLVLLSCKAYDLESAMDAIAPAVSAHTAVLPILNGLRHMDVLDRRFGAARVLGGLCVVSAAKDAQGHVLHLSQFASITFGERATSDLSPRCIELADAFARAGVEHTCSTQINQDMWNKFTFLTVLAAATCLMHASVGTLVAIDGGRAFIEQLFAECQAVAQAAHHAAASNVQAKALAMLTQAGSPLTASMLRDLESGHAVEGEHIVGDMLARARAAAIQAPLLSLAWIHLQAYQRRRTEQGGDQGK